eukprot:m51a1_g1702 putative poly(adp-ribose) polymerase (526) ;mRNA; f:498370-500599
MEWAFKNGLKCPDNVAQALTESYQKIRYDPSSPVIVSLPGGYTADFVKLALYDPRGTRTQIYLRCREAVLYVLPKALEPRSYSAEEATLLGTCAEGCVSVWVWWTGSWDEFVRDELYTAHPKWSLFGDEDTRSLESGFLNYANHPERFRHPINRLYSADYSRMVQFKDDDESWKPYTPEATLEIEKAFVARLPVLTLQINGTEYEIHLVERVQYRHEHKFYRRNITRVGPPMSEEHFQGIKLGNELLLFDDTTPPYWTQDFGQFRLVEVDMKSPEAMDIQTLMTFTIARGGHQNKYGVVAGYKTDPKSFEVISITRVQNRKEWDKYVTAKQRVGRKWNMEIQKLPCSKYLKQCPLIVPMQDERTNEYYFWHGCKFTPFIDQVIIPGQGGFDNRMACMKGMFGGGIYFAENSSKSNQYVPCSTCKSGHIESKHGCTCFDKSPIPHAMLLCRVALGNIYVSKNDSAEIQKGGYDAPKLKEDPSKSYDSVLGESVGYGGQELQYREVVVYDRALAYPEYIVYYHRHEK